MGIGPFAGPLQGNVELVAQRLEFFVGGFFGDHRPEAPAYDNAGERLGEEEPVPGVNHLGSLWLEMERAYRSSGELGKFQGTHLGAVDGPARPIGCENGRSSFVENAAQAEDSLLAPAGTGASNGVVAEKLECAGDQFAVEALADEDGRSSAAEVKGARKDALVPEAVDLSAGGKAVKGRGYAFFRNYLETPSAADGHKQSPDKTGDDCQGEALGESEFGRGSDSLRHSFDCS